MMAALIPPRGLYKTALRSQIHLALAQVALKYPSYQSMYFNQDTFTILDNGAYEGDTVTDEVLLQQASLMRVDELVVPDVMEDWGATIDRAATFIDKWKASDLKYTSLMGVVQSQGDSGSWQACIRAFEAMPEITTLGIPRHFVDKGKYMRHQVCAWIYGSGLQDRFQVHLLGTNPSFVTEIAVLNDVFPWIRSVDSSMPYNYTLAGKYLKAVSPRVERPIGYTDLNWEHAVNKNMLDFNITTFMGWANGTEGTRS